MSLGRYTILHRKDERGVIVESRTFGPDDEIPEGFGVGEYQPIYAPREDDQEPVAESVLTPWESPVGKGAWVVDSYDDAEVDEGTPRQVREDDDLTDAEREAAEALESDDDESDDEPELDEGSSREAREQSEDGELTDAEEEADEAVSEAGESTEVSPDETDEGTPVQAREQQVEVPPQGGPGSGREAWAQYAAAKGVSVSEEDKRDDIIEAVKKAGHPVD